MGTSMGLSRNSISLSEKKVTSLKFKKLDGRYKLTGRNFSRHHWLQPDVVPVDELLEALCAKVDGGSVPLPTVPVSDLRVTSQLPHLPVNKKVKPHLQYFDRANGIAIIDNYKMSDTVRVQSREKLIMAIDNSIQMG